MKINDNGIDRDMTNLERENQEKFITELQEKIDQETQAEADRQALKIATLAKLGLTADEVAALLS